MAAAVTIAAELCTGCGNCLQSCPTDVFGRATDGKAYVRYPQDCHVCFLCQDDCPGLCTECGERLADVGPEHSHDVADPRWAALQGLVEPREESQEG